MATRIDALATGAARRPQWGAIPTAIPRWLLLLLVAFGARAVTFGDPVVHVDEQFYFVTAQRMLQGLLPYVDVWDRKPIGLFLVYTPAAALGYPWGIWAYQLMALASVVGTAALIARIAERLGWGRGASAAALLYILSLNLADGQGGQSPVFYNLLMAGAVAMLLPRGDDSSEDRARIRRNMLAMLLVGLAMQIKYSAVFEGMFLGLWLLYREWQLGAGRLHIVRRGLAYAGTAALPTLAVGALYASLGHFDAWFYANFPSVLDRRTDPLLDLIGGLFEVSLALAPVLIVSGLSWRALSREGKLPGDAALVFGWLVAAVLAVLLFGSWFNHYALPVMLPGSICAAAYFAREQAQRRMLAPALLLVVLIGGEAQVVAAQHGRGNAAQLAAIGDAIGRGSGCMYVHSGDSMLFGYTGRCAASAWLFPSHLSRTRENGAIGVDQMAELDRIFAHPPAIVVMRAPFRGERMAIRARTMQHLKALGYTVRGRFLLGTVPVTVYAAPASDAAAPRSDTSRA